MADRPKRTLIPPAHFKDYTQVTTSSSEDSDQISRSQPLSSMSESINSLRSALDVLSDNTSMMDQTQNSTQLGLRSFEQPNEGSLLAVVERQDQQAAELEEEEHQRTELAKQAVQQTDEQLQRAELAKHALQQAEKQHRHAEFAKQDELRHQQQDFLQQQTTRGKGSEIDRLEGQLALLDGEAPRQINSLQTKEKLRQQQADLMRLESDVLCATNRNNIGVWNAEAFINPGYGGDVAAKQQGHFIASTFNNELLTQLLQSIRDAQRDHHQYCVNQFRNMISRMDKVAGLLERDLEFQTKPEALPITTRQGIQDFETASDEEFKIVVLYLAEQGGFNLNEAANFIIKSAVEDSLSPSLTWQGREPGTLKLQETRLAKAFYAAVSKNKAFPKPTIKEFTDAMTGALKSSKQRYRNRKRTVGAIRRPRGEDPTDGDGALPFERRRREFDADEAEC